MTHRSPDGFKGNVATMDDSMECIIWPWKHTTEEKTLNEKVNPIIKLLEKGCKKIKIEHLIIPYKVLVLIANIWTEKLTEFMPLLSEDKPVVDILYSFWL